MIGFHCSFANSAAGDLSTGVRTGRPYRSIQISWCDVHTASLCIVGLGVCQIPTVLHHSYFCQVRRRFRRTVLRILDEDENRDREGESEVGLGGAVRKTEGQQPACCAGLQAAGGGGGGGGGAGGGEAGPAVGGVLAEGEGDGGGGGS